MKQLVTGIHHVTAIAGSAQKNLDFYAGILGLHLVKKTVNFDAPEVYHFYYGDETGNPGGILTFFPYEGLVNGRQGKGMLNIIAFSAPLSSLDYWLNRLKRFDVPHEAPQERLEEVMVPFKDTDGLGLELVFNDKDTRPAFLEGPVPPEHAVRGFYNVEIWAEGYERTAGLLTTQLNHQLIAERGNRFRFAATDAPGNYVDILCLPDSMRGRPGSGTVHHIAFATPGSDTQLEVRSKLVKQALDPTPVIDRDYFTSIYFREPGGVLFEVATNGPGFMIDEPKEQLGKSLRLPEQYETYREKLEKILPPVAIRPDKYR